MITCLRNATGLRAQQRHLCKNMHCVEQQLPPHTHSHAHTHKDTELVKSSNVVLRCAVFVLFMCVVSSGVDAQAVDSWGT